MFKTNGLYVILCILIAFICYQTYTITKIKTESKNAEMKAAANINTAVGRDSTNDFNNVRAKVENDAFPLFDPLVYWANDTLKTFPVSTLTKKGPVLIFRFSGLFCDKCIDEWITCIKKYFPDLANTNQIILLGTEVNPRAKENYFGKRVLSYASSDKTLGLPFETGSSPFFFIIDGDKVCKVFFVPDTSKPALTDKYLRLVKHRFFSD